MAIGSTVHGFQITLADTRRGVYEDLTLKVARHPSETAGSLVARVLAAGLEHTEGLQMGAGLCVAGEPALAVRDATGRLRTWIDVGTPDADRLHKASKAADRVVVYCHKAPDGWLANLAGRRVHRHDEIELVCLDRDLVDGLAERLARRTAWTLSVVEQTVYVEVDGDALAGELTRVPWPVR